jgi:hypothetical protein
VLLARVCLDFREAHPGSWWTHGISLAPQTPPRTYTVITLRTRLDEWALLAMAARARRRVLGATASFSLVSNCIEKELAWACRTKGSPSTSIVGCTSYRWNQHTTYPCVNTGRWTTRTVPGQYEAKHPCPRPRLLRPAFTRLRQRYRVECTFLHPPEGPDTAGGRGGRPGDNFG